MCVCLLRVFFTLLDWSFTSSVKRYLGGRKEMGHPGPGKAKSPKISVVHDKDIIEKGKGL